LRNSKTAAVFGVLVVLAVLGAVLTGIVGGIGKRAVIWASKR
jgi:hypothetical protein